MKNIRIVISNQVYDETLRNLKRVSEYHLFPTYVKIKEKEYILGNEWERFHIQGITNLKYRNLPKKK